MKEAAIPDDELLMPCPFCAEGAELELIEQRDGLFFVRCKCCNTTGPDGSDAECAIIQWQKRENHMETVH